MATVEWKMGRGRGRVLLPLLLLMLLIALPGPGAYVSAEASAAARSCVPELPEYEEFSDYMSSLYEDIDLAGTVDYEVFELAMIGYFNLLADDLLKREYIITIIDYTLPSTEERLAVIDLDARELLHKSLVAHGRNTGENYAEDFSNEPGSLQSSLGFYVTEDDYVGAHGKSLKLSGVDTLYNDNAERRYIVVHGAWYCSEEFIEKYGRLGRSWGCPVLPIEMSKEIIDLVKDGTCMFMYSDDDEYLENSIYLEIDGAVEEFGKRHRAR
ncbi:MAG: murein L,D-transpeptidase catalytic domain family protein [bacterium]